MTTQNKTIYIHSLGCKVNSYESFCVGDIFVQNGYVLTSDYKAADVILLNSCSVTSRADQKSRQFVSRYRRSNADAILVVMGCSMQSFGDTATKLGADIVVGTTNRNKIFELVKDFEVNHKQVNLVKKSIRPAKYEEFGSHAYCENVRAYLKIQDGCDNFCTYCLIPLIRGNSRSRGIEDTLLEAKDLVNKGYQEIIISGIHIGGYGADLGDGSYRLSHLLKDIEKQNPSLKRIRISSIEETEIDEHFLEVLKCSKVIVDHLHIPLQSGSSSVLKRMHRKYDTEAFLRKLDALRAIRPDISITTDIISGFPEETDEEWNETINFVKKAKFSEIHCFPYSPRPNTLASTMKQVNDTVKTNRNEELLQLSEQLNKEYVSKFVGKEVEVLFEEYDSETKLAKGHTSNYLYVVEKFDVSPIGKFVKVIFGLNKLSN